MLKRLNKMMDEVKDVFGENAMSVIMTDFAAVVISATIITLCFLLGDSEKDQYYNLLITLIGALLGWALGMFFAPYDKTETDKFTAIGQSISVFVSGYVISKIDRFLEATMFGADKLPSEITWIRLGLFVSSLVLTVLTVFSNRKYFSAGGSRWEGAALPPPGPGAPSGSTTTPKTPTS